MKKIMVLIAGILILVSCSQNDNVEVVTIEPISENVEAYAVLSKDLAVYNQIYSEYTKSSRGFWGWLKRFFGKDGDSYRTSGAGTIVGKLCDAIYGSLLAASDNTDNTAVELSNGLNFPVIIDPDHTVLVDSGYAKDSLYIGLDSVGILHNKIILEIYSEDSTFLDKSLTTRELVEKIIPAANKCGLSLTEKDEEDMIQRLELQSVPIQLTPDEISNKKVLDDYVNVVSTLPKGQISGYTNGYAKVISESKLTSEDKQKLVGAVAVSGNSALLWKAKKE